MTALYDAVQELRGRYPDSLSAVMPALQLAQAEHGGWLPPEAFREVADALDLTPAYCLSIASFYDMFRLEPVGETLVEVCTNISCGLAGAQAVVRGLEHELGLRAGETSEDGRFTLRTVECIGGCGWATVVAVNNRHRLHVKPEDVQALAAELRGETAAEGAFSTDPDELGAAERGPSERGADGDDG